ncbi:LGFP repeat-containing protein [Leucobacter sp. HNU]|uniref:LGFP repeat-containing protein n=1 Tax=Leucobacter sp. HNU TaxID=3236805 RepID=UPI003A7FB7F9
MASERPRSVRGLLITLTSAAALLVGSLVGGPAAQAAPVVGFEAGNIISDGLFYDGNAMSAAQVQTFLNGKVPRCTIGDPGRTPGTPIYGSTVAGACLRNYTMNTTSRAANAYCSAYAGAANESAAAIIAKVGRACGISQKVLLVMLEKEQSLVQDDWPTVRQFNVAMGYACPDSGPNNSANCDPTQTGFYQQVYRAAWQLKVYRAFPNDYNYRPFASNAIQWHPNAGCGTSQVYIQNWATAALYIYTPYRPNQAALNAGWGTGDACSSYGNRNFYNFYTTWFGSTKGIDVDQRLLAFYNANGGAQGKYGAPVAAATAVSTGIEQRFAGGRLYWSQKTGTSAVVGGFLSGYLNAGGPGSYLGFPTGIESLIAGGSRQEFERGTGYWTAKDGTAFINGAIRSLYGSEGGPSGYLGFPIGDEVRAGGVSRQEFQNGTAYWSAATGPSVINGAIRSLYNSEGGPSGYLGLPVGPEVRAGGVSRQEFQNGTAYWSAATGPSVINGAIRSLYNSEGGPSGYLGLPVGPEVRAGGVSRQEFQNGTAYWSAATGPSVINGAIRSLYNSEGGPSGYLGLPVGPEVRAGGVSRQEFQNGTAYWSAPTGAALINGAIRATYQANWGPSSALGLPIGPEVRSNGSATQRFEHGTMTWTAKTGVTVTLQATTRTPAAVQSPTPSPAS